MNKEDQKEPLQHRHMSSAVMLFHRIRMGIRSSAKITTPKAPTPKATMIKPIVRQQRMTEATMKLARVLSCYTAAGQSLCLDG